MAASQVVVYFEKQEDALLFTLAASSILSGEEPARRAAGERVAREICKATRITTAGALNRSDAPVEAPSDLPEPQCA